MGPDDLQTNQTEDIKRCDSSLLAIYLVHRWLERPTSPVGGQYHLSLSNRVTTPERERTKKASGCRRVSTPNADRSPPTTRLAQARNPASNKYFNPTQVPALLLILASPHHRLSGEYETTVIN